MTPPTLRDAAALAPTDVLARLGSSRQGLDEPEASRRLQQFGPNAVRSHGSRALAVLGRQLRSPLLVLLVAAATVSLTVGERTDAVIILVIVGLSTGLGFVNVGAREAARGSGDHPRRASCACRLRGHTPESAGPSVVRDRDLVPWHRLSTRRSMGACFLPLR